MSLRRLFSVIISGRYRSLLGHSKESQLRILGHSKSFVLLHGAIEGPTLHDGGRLHIPHLNIDSYGVVSRRL